MGDIKAPANCEILGDKHMSVIAVAAPRTEEEEAAEAAAAAEAAPGEVEMIKEKKEEGEEGRPGRRQGGREGRGQGCREGRSGQGRGEGCPRRRQKAAPGAEKKAAPAAAEEEVVWVAARLRPGGHAGAPHGELVSHRGLGQSRRGLRADPAQCGLPRGRAAGRALAGRLDLREEVQRTAGLGATGRAPGAPVRAADVHEFERRGGRGGDGVLPGAADADCWWWWTMRICRWANSGCGRAAAAAGIMGWSPSSSIWARASMPGCGSASGGRAGRARLPAMCWADLVRRKHALADRVLTVASDQAETWLEAGIQKAMSQFNGAVRRLRERRKRAVKRYEGLFILDTAAQRRRHQRCH